MPLTQRRVDTLLKTQNQETAKGSNNTISRKKLKGHKTKGQLHQIKS